MPAKCVPWRHQTDSRIGSSPPPDARPAKRYRQRGIHLGRVWRQADDSCSCPDRAPQKPGSLLRGCHFCFWQLWRFSSCHCRAVHQGDCRFCRAHRNSGVVNLRSRPRIWPQGSSLPTSVQRRFSIDRLYRSFTPRAVNKPAPRPLSSTKGEKKEFVRCKEKQLKARRTGTK